MTEIYTYVFESEDPRLARHVQHDERSKSYEFDTTGLSVVSVQHERKSPILDQGSLGSCTGNAGIGCLGTEPFFKLMDTIVRDWSEDAAVQLYSDATKIDEYDGEYPPTDTGSSGLAIAKVLQRRGWIQGYQHTFTFEDALKALTVRPVITGIPWYNSFYYPDSEGIVRIADKAKVVGGHEFVLDGIDAEKGLIWATNSWGTGWGQAGKFAFEFATFERLLHEDGDVTIFVPLDVVSPPSPDPVTEVVTVSDQALWNSVRDWAYARHTYTKNINTASALKDWAKAKGLQ